MQFEQNFGSLYGAEIFPRVEQNVLGAKNFLRYPYAGGGFNTSIFVINPDGSISIASNTYSSRCYYYLESDSNKFAPSAGDYILSIDGLASNVAICIGAYNGNTWVRNLRYITSNDGRKVNEVLSLDYTDYDRLSIYIEVPAGTVLTNSITVYPMLRLVSDPDDTYEPYAMTNRQLTEDKADNSVIAPVENGPTASRAYAVGEHFIRDRAFCTAKTSIASGAAFTLNTNYTAGTVGDGMRKKVSEETLSPQTGYETVSDYGTMRVVVKEDLGIAELVWNGNATTPTVGEYNFVLPSKYKPYRASVAPVRKADFMEVRTNGTVMIRLTDANYSAGTLTYILE